MPQKKVGLVGFDVNGTLFDDTPQLIESLLSVFDYFGKPRMSVKALRERFTQPWTKIYRDAGIDEQAAPEAKLYELYNKAYQAQPPAVLSTGVREALHWLYRHGIPAAVISTQQNNITLPLLQQQSIAALFKYLEGSVHDKAKTLTALCKAEGIAPSVAAYVGDQDSDMRFAREAGCIAIAYCGGVHTKQKLARAGAQYFIKDFRALKALPIFT